MMINELAMWDSLEIAIKDKNYTELKSRVAEYIDGGILITTPSSENGAPRFVDGQSVKVICSKNRTVTEWDCVYDGVKHLGNIIMHRLICDKHGITINRRETYRVPLLIDISLRRPSLKGEYKGYLKDISEEGVGFNASEDFKMGDIVTFNIVWEKYKLDVKARIVRKVELEKGRGFEYGAATDAIDRVTLGRILYELQIRELKRKR